MTDPSFKQSILLYLGQSGAYIHAAQNCTGN